MIPNWDEFDWDDGTLWDGGQAGAWTEQPAAGGAWLEQAAPSGTWIEQPEP